MLVGCQTHQPAIQTKIVYVNKEVPVPCVRTVPTTPVWEVDTLPNPATPTQKAQALLIDRLSAKAYIGELEAVIKGCQVVK